MRLNVYARITPTVLVRGDRNRGYVSTQDTVAKGILDRVEKDMPIVMTLNTSVHELPGFALREYLLISCNGAPNQSEHLV
jgi:hypothetical protein